MAFAAMYRATFVSLLLVFSLFRQEAGAEDPKSDEKLAKAMNDLVKTHYGVYVIRAEEPCKDYETFLQKITNYNNLATISCPPPAKADDKVCHYCGSATEKLLASKRRLTPDGNDEASGGFRRLESDDERVGKQLDAMIKKVGERGISPIQNCELVFKVKECTSFKKPLTVTYEVKILDKPHADIKDIPEKAASEAYKNLLDAYQKSGASVRAVLYSWFLVLPLLAVSFVC